MEINTLTQPTAATAEPSGPNRVRVAVATKEGIAVDLHFGHVRAFDVYEADEAEVDAAGTPLNRSVLQGG